jgi:4-amino-4-deoxy-L-arabinose transferase-like glycosyltransferase
VSVGWALLVPPWQSPDENSHFAYVQELAEEGDLPGKESRPIYSSEQALATERSNADQTAAVPQTKPEWSEQAYERWRQLDAALPDTARKDGGGPNPAATNPPAYYLLETIPYQVASGGDIFDRLYLGRLVSALLAIVTATGAWLLAGELFGPRRLLQLAAAAVTGLQPMVTFLSATATPDALLFALWSVALWLGVRILKRGLTTRDAVALFAIVGIAIATKATSYALLPAALLVLGVGAARLRARGEPGVLAVVAVALAALALPVGTWLVTAAVLDRPAVNRVDASADRPAPSLTSLNPRELGSYMWQFYLPRLGFQRDFGGLPDMPVYNIWVKQGWAAFGWLEVQFPDWVYAVLGLLSATSLAAGAVLLWRRRRELDWAVVAFLATAALVLLAGLHWTEYRTLAGGAGPFNQGRYLLPLLPLGGAAVAALLSLLPAGRRAPAAGVLLGGLAVLQVASLAIVAGRFYA